MGRSKASRGDSIPIRQLDEMKGRLADYAKKHDPNSLALLEANINDSTPWYDVDGDEQREIAMKAYFGTLVLLGVKREGELFRLGRASFDKFWLYSTCQPDHLEGLARDIKESLDETRIPNPSDLQKAMKEWRGKTVEVDPTSRTVRVGVAYQRHKPYDIDGLISTVMRTADEAKALDGQILVVEFNPIIR